MRDFPDVCGCRRCTFRMVTVLSAIVEMEFGDAANVSKPAASRMRLFKLGPVYAKSHIISTATAKFRKPGNIASSLSNRVQIRRQPLSLRNSRSTSFRSLQSSRSQSHLTFGSPSAARPASYPRSSRGRGSGRLRRRGPSPEERSQPACPSFPAGRGLRALRGPARRTGKSHCLAVTCRDHRAANSCSRTLFRDQRRNRQIRVEFGAMFRRDLFHDCAPLYFISF